MGRPPRTEGATHPYAVRMTNNERALYEAAAAAVGVSLADWIRTALTAAAGKS